MSLKTRLRTIFMCAALELGVLSGVPMRPEEIRSLISQINQPKLAHVLPTDEQSGDDPPTGSPRPHQEAARSTPQKFSRPDETLRDGPG
jgi:hypothetical protein